MAERPQDRRDVAGARAGAGAAPARRRPVAATLGALFAVGVSYPFLTLGWYYPSDVLGGFLVAVTWIELAIAGVTDR